MCENFSGRLEFTMREIASLIGTLVCTLPGVEFGALYYRHLEYNKEAALKDDIGDFERKMVLLHAGVPPLLQLLYILIMVIPTLLTTAASHKN